MNKNNKEKDLFSVIGLSLLPFSMLGTSCFKINQNNINESPKFDVITFAPENVYLSNVQAEANVDFVTNILFPTDTHYISQISVYANSQLINEDEDYEFNYNLNQLTIFANATATKDIVVVIEIKDKASHPIIEPKGREFILSHDFNVQSGNYKYIFELDGFRSSTGFNMENYNATIDFVGRTFSGNSVNFTDVEAHFIKTTPGKYALRFIFEFDDDGASVLPIEWQNIIGLQPSTYSVAIKVDQAGEAVWTSDSYFLKIEKYIKCLEYNEEQNQYIHKFSNFYGKMDSTQHIDREYMPLFVCCNSWINDQYSEPSTFSVQLLSPIETNYENDDATNYIFNGEGGDDRPYIDYQKSQFLIGANHYFSLSYNNPKVKGKKVPLYIAVKHKIGDDWFDIYNNFSSGEQSEDEHYLYFTEN